MLSALRGQYKQPRSVFARGPTSRPALRHHSTPQRTFDRLGNYGKGRFRIACRRVPPQEGPGIARQRGVLTGRYNLATVVQAHGRGTTPGGQGGGKRQLPVAVDVLALEPGHAKARHNLAVLLRQQGRAEEAAAGASAA
jgi:hypothetical protein